MRYSQVVAWTLFSFVTRALSSPLHTGYTSQETTTSFSESTYTQTIVTKTSSPPSDTKTSPALEVQPTRIDEAHVVLPCQDCTSAGDEALVLDLKVLPGDFDRCRHVPIAVNSESVDVESSQHQASGTNVFTLSSGRHLLEVLTSVNCDRTAEGSGKSSASVLTLTVQQVDGKQIKEPFGFTVHFQDSRAPVLSNLVIWQEVSQSDVQAVITISLASLWSTYADAFALVQKVGTVREQSIDDKQALSAGTVVDDEAIVTANLEPFSSASFRTHQKLLEQVVELSSDIEEEPVAMPDIKPFGEKSGYEDGYVELKSEDASGDRKAVQKSISGQNSKHRFSQENPLVRLVEVVSAGVGLLALAVVAFIRKRCCSLRRRVERLADREERMTARAYRRAARREAMRRQWRDIKTLFSKSKCLSECEEKRGLLITAAEKGQNYPQDTPGPSQDTIASTVQDLVAAMIRASADFEPGLAHRATRSRSGSLPSYKSEQLPDYSSQPDEGNQVVDGFRPGRPTLSSRASTIVTPDSSIPDLSSRCSGETLRTNSDK